MRQSSGNMEGLGRDGVASPAIALVTVEGYTAVSSSAASAAAASAASASARLSSLCSCFVLRRQDRRMTLPRRTGCSLHHAPSATSGRHHDLHAYKITHSDKHVTGVIGVHSSPDIQLRGVWDVVKLVSRL